MTQAAGCFDSITLKRRIYRSQAALRSAQEPHPSPMKHGYMLLTSQELRIHFYLTHLHQFDLQAQAPLPFQLPMIKTITQLMLSALITGIICPLRFSTQAAMEMQCII